MRNIILYIAMSLDGYIAEKDGSCDFLVGDGTDPLNRGSYLYYYDTVDSILIGYNTYEQIITKLSPDVWPYEGKKTYVLTHRTLRSREGVTFTSQAPSDLIRMLKAMPGGNIWVCGGADVTRQLMNDDLIDRYYFSIVPAVIGSGIRLFEEGQRRVRFQLKRVERYNGIIDLLYEPLSKLESPFTAEDTENGELPRRNAKADEYTNDHVIGDLPDFPLTAETESAEAKQQEPPFSVFAPDSPDL